jgi:leader peptidase (prepilin peptidase)/N-methyltransferase
MNDEFFHSYSSDELASEHPVIADFLFGQSPDSFLKLRICEVARASCPAAPCYNTPMPLVLANIVAAALLGWIAGMLANYLADILPARRRLTGPICLDCGEPYGWMSYLLWPRRCPTCSGRRSWRTWLVEAIFIVAAVWLSLSPPSRFGFFAGLLLLIYFGIVVIIDMEHRLILHVVSAGGTVLGLVYGIWLHGPAPTLIGGAAGFLAMLCLYFLGALLVRWISRRRGDPDPQEALGFGDVTLSGVLGLMLGWPGIVAGLLLTIFLAGAVSFVYLIIMLAGRRYRLNMAIPYGPFLIGSAFLLLYFKDFIGAQFGW